MKKTTKKSPLVTLRIERADRDALKVSAAQLGISIKALVSRLARQRQ